MGVFSSVLGFFGISAALRTSPVPIAGIKEKLFKPGESGLRRSPQDRYIARGDSFGRLGSTRARRL
jgi:hypothetical protein